MRCLAAEMLAKAEQPLAALQEGLPLHELIQEHHSTVMQAVTVLEAAGGQEAALHHILRMLQTTLAAHADTVQKQGPGMTVLPAYQECGPRVQF